MPLRGHFSKHSKNRLPAKVKSAVHTFDGFLDLVDIQVGIAESRDLDPVLGHQGAVVDPPVFYRLGMEFRALERGRDGDLDGVWVQLLGEANGLFDGLPCLDGKAE